MCAKPPFRLELPDKNVRIRRTRINYTKTEYSPKVKVTDWQKQLEGAPIDNDPYCPGGLNFFLSHYNRVGNAPDEPYASTTHTVLSQIHLKPELDRLNTNLNKSMINYYTYKDTLACEVDLNDTVCPQLCAESYLTTMQKSYTPPYPYAMPRLSFPTIPFMQNRKYRWAQDPTLCCHKFLDEGYTGQVRHIQKIKGFRATSYDPLLAKHSDGTPLPEHPQACFELGF